MIYLRYYFDMVSNVERTFTIGVDEMGRGPLAGPLYVCACGTHNIKNLPKSKKNLPIRDSKKLTEKTREDWWKILNAKKKNGGLYLEYSAISEKIIDSRGISYSTKLGATKSVEKVLIRARVSSGKIKIQLDGNLFVNSERLQEKFPRCKFFITTTITGDEKIKIISFASVYGKVMRDRYMRKLDNIYPQYGFKRHKGYGTKGHIEALKKYGLTPIHRKLFLRNFDF